MAISIQMARFATFLKSEQDAMINTLSARSLHEVFIPVVSYIPGCSSPLTTTSLLIVSSSVSARLSYDHVIDQRVFIGVRTSNSFLSSATFSHSSLLGQFSSSRMAGTATTTFSVRISLKIQKIQNVHSTTFLLSLTY